VRTIERIATARAVATRWSQIVGYFVIAIDS
jgi:hypothetical protein